MCRQGASGFWLDNCKKTQMRTNSTMLLVKWFVRAGFFTPSTLRRRLDMCEISSNMPVTTSHLSRNFKKWSSNLCCIREIKKNWVHPTVSQLPSQSSNQFCVGHQSNLQGGYKRMPNKCASNLQAASTIWPQSFEEVLQLLQWHLKPKIK